MYRKALSSGLLTGFLLALAVSFILVDDTVPRLLPGQSLLEIPWVPRDLLRPLSLYISALFLLLAGPLAAIRARSRQPVEGLKAGAVSGLAAAVVVYALLLSPLALLRQALPLYRDVLGGVLKITADNFSRALSPYATATWQASAVLAFTLPLLGMLVGGIEGFFFTLLRRMLGGGTAAEEPAPALLDQVQDTKARPDQDREERALRAGLLGGLIVGGFFSLELSLFVLQVALSGKEDLLNPGQYLTTGQARLLLALAGPLALLLPLAVILHGGMGVLLLKNPPSRFRSRLRADLVAAVVGSTLVTMLFLLPIANVALLVAPATSMLTSGQAAAPASPDQGAMSLPAGLQSTPESLAGLLRTARDLLLVYGLLPLLGILALTLAGFLFGLVFVLLSAYVWPRRPIDRAASLARRLRREPDTLLPRVYALFQKDPQAGDILPYLAYYCQRRKEQPAAVVVAAYDTIYRDPQRTAEALRLSVDTLAQTSTWRWRGEIGELHRFLGEGWQARNLYHLGAIQPLSAEHTSSLPPALARAWGHLSNIVVEVKKAQRLDDPNGRTIYLNRALEEIQTAERLVTEKTVPRKRREKRLDSLPYPEQKALSTLLSNWRDILHESLRDLRGRAALRVELLTRQTAYLPRLTLRFRVTNEGLNVAERVRIALEPSPDYQLGAESEARVELLPPGEQREVELGLEPRNPRPLRVLLRLLYNDAVDENRELTFADEVIFAAAERPFQRIFPIPYVTGTPLKSGEMFFGRQDVFDYIREHLLGVYQNNIIVLHGQRRTGKTSVLYQLPDIMRDTHYCVLLDMQGVVARSEAEFFYALSDEMAYALEKASLEVPLPPRTEYDAQPEFTFRSRFLRSIYPALGQKHLLLLFDEFEELQHHVEQGHIGAGIFTFLRTLMQHEEPLDFIFAGTHRLEDLAAEYWSILFNIATYKQISFLERSEVERLITEPVAPFGMEYDPLAVQHIYGVTAGHPFLTQLVCHETVTYHNETARSYITVADVDTVLERITERGEAHFKYVWAGADPAERLAMLALAELLVHAEAASAAEIADLTRNRRQSLTTDAALHALVRLESRDIVSRTAPASERFRFRVDLVRRWVAHSRQLIDTVNLE